MKKSAAIPARKFNRLRAGFLIVILAMLSLLAVSCGAQETSAPPAEAVVQTVEVEKEVVVTQALATAAPAVEEPAAEAPAEQIPQPTATARVVSPTSSATQAVQQETETPIPLTPLAAVTRPPAGKPAESIETRLVELEWPERMRLGDSDVIRLALIPYRDGYVVTAEFPEHKTQSQPVEVARPGGYELYGLARLEGTGFEISPTDVEQYLPEGQPVTWRWSLSPRRPGQQRLNLSLRLLWKPATGSTSAPLPEQEAFSRALQVRVVSLLGLTQLQALAAGLFSLLFGAGLGIAALIVRPSSPSALRLSIKNPNSVLVIEPKAGLTLNDQERTLLKTLFQPYARLVLEKEYTSGYSGARTFLVRPVMADGQADAYTIAKFGEQHSIQREFENYGTFVKYRLPPITARIQDTPVTTPPPRRARGQAAPPYHLAGLRYTFIGESSSQPASLREALLADPDPAILHKLFDTFGPSWWMQRHPYTFRAAVEYDRLLPTHLVIEPRMGLGEPLDSRQSASALELEVGEQVQLQGFRTNEIRADGRSLSLIGQAPPGEAPLRVRWLGLQDPHKATGVIVATRHHLLRDFVQGFDLFGLDDPFERLPALLKQTIQGTRSTIHGDLNLENILLGPGGLIWLIDFAQTREGHPLSDFAHLHAEIIAHIISTHQPPTPGYLRLLNGQPDPEQAAAYRLHQAMLEIAGQCLFNPKQPGEYLLVLTLACLGALKFTNLSPIQKHLLYLSAAYFSQSL